MSNAIKNIILLFINNSIYDFYINLYDKCLFTIFYFLYIKYSELFAFFGIFPSSSPLLQKLINYRLNIISFFHHFIFSWKNLEIWQAQGAQKMFIRLQITSE